VTELIGIGARGPAAVITLRRDNKLNALSSQLEGELSRALRDERVRGSACVIVAGGPRAFSAGADVNEMRDLDPASILAYYRETGGVYKGR
jgi:enoyl-CoA hydratase/carnithine racemase